MYNLFIDESGKLDLRSVDVKAPHFSLAGVIVHDNLKQPIKIRADRIKFKYWGKVDIVFHANEIRQQKSNFEIFSIAGSKFTIADFCSDFTNHFLNDNYKIGLVSINKVNYLKKNPGVAHAVSKLALARPGSNWEKQVIGTSNNLLKKAATELFTMYLDYLVKKDASGEVIMESSNDIQDMLIYSAYNKILTSGFPSFNMDSQAVRKRLTGISFVTKLNHNIESQLSDIAAHYLNLESKLLDLIITSYPKPYDEDIIKILKSKGFFYRKKTSGVPENSFLRMF